MILSEKASRIPHADDCAFRDGKKCSCSLHWRQIVQTLQEQIEALSRGEPAGEKYWHERADEQQSRANRAEFLNAELTREVEMLREAFRRQTQKDPESR